MSLFALFSGLCRSETPKDASATPHESAVPAGIELGNGFRVAAPVVVEDLVLFPITAAKQVKLGPVTTLEAALAKGQAEVREMGARSDAPANRSPRRRDPQQAPQQAQNAVQQAGGRGLEGFGGSARVDTLVIENKGDLAIYVLAGTVVKGGRQDRQIGQDFIVGAHDTVPVDAFCVERGRWSGTRAGKFTGGKFSVTGQLAGTKVRAAAQHKKNQAEVWSEVSKVNTANGKSASSGTLMATLDDENIRKQREALVAKLEAALGRVSPRKSVVGFAYALDGKVQSARWFVNHDLFRLHRETLLNTAAVGALTARGGKPATAARRVEAKAVSTFVKEIEKAPKQESRAAGKRGENDYIEAPKGYGSKTKMRAPSTRAGKKPKPAVPISADYTAK